MAEPNFVRLTDAVNGARDRLEERLRRIQSSLGLSDDEVDVLRRVNRILREPTPSVQMQIQNRVSDLDALRVELNELIFDVSVKASDAEYRYREPFDKEYMTLVRADRPSHAAIEAEILATHPALRDLHQTLENFEAMKGLLFGYMKSLDHSKETCMRLWGTY